MKKFNKDSVKAKIKLWLKLIINWRFLVCFGIAWMITNGWSYIFIGCGTIFNIPWMLWTGTTYLAFLWLPWSVEKIITFAIALFLVRKLFKNHKDELEKQLNEAMGKTNSSKK